MPAKTGKELIEDARARIREVTPQDVMQMQARREPVVLLDVRDHTEWSAGHIPNAIHITRGTLEGKVESVIPRAERIVVYCASGNRSALAAETLQQMGYMDVASMAGGIRGWMAAGGPVQG